MLSFLAFAQSLKASHIQTQIVQGLIHSFQTFSMPVIDLCYQCLIPYDQLLRVDLSLLDLVVPILLNFLQQTTHLGLLLLT